MIRAVIQAGFGNQLFQYATAYSLARDIGQSLELDVSFFKDYRKGRPGTNIVYKLNQLCIDDVNVVNNPKSYPWTRLRAKVTPLRQLGQLPLIVEDIPNCREDQRGLFESIGPHGATLFGFWQNTAYFERYKEDLQRQYVPCHKPENPVRALCERVINANSVGVHIRRGDFVGLGWDKGRAYYDEGMRVMRERLGGVSFFIVTDDVAWAGAQYGTEDDVTIVDFNTPTKDIDEFFLLSSCSHQVISESTFGWWAAYLNQNKDKVVVCPADAKGQMFSSAWIRV